MTGIGGMEQGAALRFTGVGRSGHPSGDKAMERCLKRRAKGDSGGDAGMDGLEALVHKRQQKSDGGNQQKKG